MERAGSRAVAVFSHARRLQMVCELEENVRDSDARKIEHCDETKMAAEKLFSYLDGDSNRIAVRSYFGIFQQQTCLKRKVRRSCEIATALNEEARAWFEGLTNRVRSDVQDILPSTSPTNFTHTRYIIPSETPHSYPSRPSSDPP
jgi:hypothetical protein